MEITDVRIFPRGEAKLKAFASMTFDDCFRVKGLRVVEGSNGLFVAMPSRKLPDGTFEDVAHPLTREMKAQVEEKVLTEYKKMVGEGGE
ncbi:SpoVG family protein [candidate division WOR-3 bacterium]|nr:SpoVG family protein [candidate division WOR-3 bacterium]